MRILLVEDKDADARRVEDLLAAVTGASFTLVRVRRAAEAAAKLAEEDFDAVMLDLALPDARGLDAIAAVADAAGAAPIVVLSEIEDETLALQAVRRGAQDYLVKGEWDGKLLLRVLRHAIERKRTEQTINHLAYHDGLTNLPNRRLFLDRLDQAVARARRSGATLAVIFFDLDHFKAINDTSGHGAGDELLRQVAERLKMSTRASDTVARVGGDEFTIVLSDLGRVDDVVTFAEKLLESLRAPFSVDGRDVRVTASIGISLFPDDGEGAESLLEKADGAMYRAKEGGRDNYQFYLPEVNARASEQAALAHGLNKALERGEMFLEYQPIVDLATMRVSAMEALLRWRHPERGVMTPRQFLSLAEAAALVDPITSWMIGAAIRQARAWVREGPGGVRVHVNLPHGFLAQRGWGQMIARAIAESGLARGAIALEIGENDALRFDDRDLRALERLDEIGVPLVLDGFGGGYSSLIRVARLRLAALKIDASLTRASGAPRGEPALLCGLVAFAHALGLRVVALGVDASDHLAPLAAAGCDAAQGEHVSPPLGAEEATQYLRRGGSTVT